MPNPRNLTSAESVGPGRAVARALPAIGRDDRVAIVTGASRGIGRQIVLELAGRGAKVAVAARTVEPPRTLPGTIAETVALIEEAGGVAVEVPCDVTKTEDLEHLVATTVKRFGRLDVLVNNAEDMRGGPGSPHLPAEEQPRQAWLRQFDTNVHAPFTLMTLAVPHMRARGGGVIVNISSSAAEMVSMADAKSGAHDGRGTQLSGPGYATTKAALNRLTNSFAADLIDENIAVVGVDPGVSRTELFDLLADRGVVDDAQAGPMDTPVQAVLDIINATDPLVYSGQIIRVRPSEMPIMRFLGIQIHVPAPPGVYRATLEAAPDTLNANGMVHGAALATLIDHSAGYGVQRLIGRRGVTSDLHIRYLAAAHAGSLLTAEASVVRAGRTQIVMDVRVTDDAGRLIATADLGLAVPPNPSV